MRDVFEVRRYDAAGRVGDLEIPRASLTVDTPALLPVVNPHVQTVEPRRLAETFGAQILITNSYVLHGSDDLRKPALDRGLHDLLGFPGAIMTDSGSFQLAEYGEIDVTTEEIVQFQHDVGSDIATPVDVPTPPDTDHDRAAEELTTTRERIETATAMEVGDMLVTAPVQGSTHPDLREQAGREAARAGGDVFPVGAMVPLLNEYRYADVVDAVVAAKHGLPESAPVHLFGAGHPMMFALAAAAGCDLFDSAAYALYARDDRYLTVRGTDHLDELETFPCACPVCTEWTPTDLAAEPERTRGETLAEHNLYVSFAEMRRVRQSIREGTLLELVETRARSHPAVLDGYRALLDHADFLEATDRVSKDAFFYLSAESASRPEVHRHHDRLARLDPGDEVVLNATGQSIPQEQDETVWPVRPPFGPLPTALQDVYPLTAEVPDRLDTQAYDATVGGITSLADAHTETALTLIHDGWPESALTRLPEWVNVRLVENETEEDTNE